jgi:hypothetical protein
MFNGFLGFSPREDDFLPYGLPKKTIGSNLKVVIRQHTNLAQWSAAFRLHPFQNITIKP